MSQAALAEDLNLHMRNLMPDFYRPALDITQSNVSDLEIGRTDISLPTLLTIASYFGVDAEDLIVDSLREILNGG